MMRGRTITFHSALCLLDGRTGQHQLADVQTLATFRALEDAELEAYLLLEHPYDVAGSAKSEGLASPCCRRWNPTTRRPGRAAADRAHRHAAGGRLSLLRA